ncbi:MAG: hypothetical protein Q6373_012510 [Candidatus Sigynarchaeota archaeon]
MAFRKFIVANLYIITIAWFAGGFGWMFVLAFIPGSFDMVLPAFFITIAGNLWLWAANHYSNREIKPKEPKHKKERGVIEEKGRQEEPQLVTASSK